MDKRFWIFGLVATSLLFTGCPEKRRPEGSATGKPMPAKTTKPPSAEAKGPLAGYADTLDKSEKKAAEVTGLTTLNQAVQQFNVVEGRLPRTLDELVENRYLAKIPAAPRGKRFLYNPKEGEVTVGELAPVAPDPEPAAAPETAVPSEPVATPAEPASEPQSDASAAVPPESDSSPAPAADSAPTTDAATQ